MNFLIPVISRYSSIAVQFILITLIARTLSPHDTGIYFSVSGLVLSTYFIAGLGIPDGLVAACAGAAAIGRSDSIQTMATRSLKYSLALSTIVPTCTFILVRTFINESHSAIYAAIWATGYSLTFITSQTLVAIGKVQLGSFIFYSAVNTCLCLSTIPYLLFATSPNLQSVLAINAASALFTGSIALAFTVIEIRKLERSRSAVSIFTFWKNGLFISLGRFVQAGILWTPVWIAGVILTHSDAAQVGLTTRLLSIVGALLAAIRFSIRPTIAFLAAKKEWLEIGKISSEVAFIASTFTLATMGAAWIFGDHAITTIFGNEYSPASILLIIMLGASLAESLSGTVDEALKMSMNSGIVLTSQIIALVLAAVLGLILSNEYGSTGAAISSVLAFTIMYGIQIAWLARLHGIIALPKIPNGNLFNRTS